MGRRQPFRLFRPGLRQIQSPVEKCVPLVRDIGCEHANLAIGDLTGRPGILPSHPARCRALLEKTGLVDHQHRVGIPQMLDDMIAQRIGVPMPASKQGLLSPWPRIARSFCAHPAGLARFIAQQCFQKPARRRRHPLLAEYRAHPRPGVPQRLQRQGKNILDRGRAIHLVQNHGDP